MAMKRWTIVMGCVSLGAGATVLPRATMAEESVPVLVRAAASDWPQWRGPCRDGTSSETGLLQSWPEGGPKLVWKATGIGRGYSAPIVVAGNVYITGDFDKELAISAFTLDGQRNWKAANGEAWKRSYPGARSSCCFDGGKVYHLNAQGDLICLNAATGDKVWAVNVLERYEAKNITWGISESVLVDGDLVFATPAGAKGLVVAHDKRSGAAVWATPALDGEQASYSSPILIREGARKLLINCGSKHAFAVDVSTGALVWKLPHVDPKNTVNITPVLSGHRLFLSNASRDYGALFGVTWTGDAVSRAWLDELKISHGGMVCVEGRLYGASSRGAQMGWVSVDADTGKVSQASSEKDLADGAMAFADGRFYWLTARGVMTLQSVAGEGLRTVGSFPLVGEKVQDVWAHPVLCQGRLFLRYHDTLFCYDVRR